MSPIEKAERAKQLLADEVLTGAFNDIRMQLVATLEATPVGDVDTQHEVALMLQLLKRLRGQLQSHLNDAAVIKAKQKHDSFIARVRERIA